MKEYEIERMARDARLGPIGGGTDEIMREILGKTLGLESIAGTAPRGAV
jgi:acyl-CoA dehydrogenase